MGETTGQDTGATVDVVVVGGGAAGLSAALVLGRARRRVAVIDAGAPRNAPAEGVHGFLTRDGTDPRELLAIGRQEVRRYGGDVLTGTAAAALRTGDGFAVALDDGRSLEARRLVVASGLVDDLPDVPGVRERWGRDVLHCPYCHGWEVRDEPIGVLATGPMAIHQVLLFRQWTPDLVLFTSAGPAPTPEQAEQLEARGVRVVPGRVAALEVEDDRLTGVRLEDGTVVPRRAMAVGTRMVARSSLLESLGLRPVPHPSGMGESFTADALGRTDVPGVWLAGNVTDLSAQVLPAAAAGAVVAAQVNADLVAEDTERAVAAARSAVPAGA